MKCVKCNREFKLKNIKCKVCSKDRGEDMYHLYSDKCEECQ